MTAAGRAFKMYITQCVGWCGMAGITGWDGSAVFLLMNFRCLKCLGCEQLLLQLLACNFGQSETLKAA